MDALAPPSLMQQCKDAEAFETPRWALEGILDVELTTRFVIDPCAGTGVIPAAVRDFTGIHTTVAYDIVDWRQRIPQHMKWNGRIHIADWLTMPSDTLEHATVIMNPPFSLAEKFVDRAWTDLKARKVICFQRQAWRESNDRKDWWRANPPARVWVCGARASCWRFDLLDCQHPEGFAGCPSAKRRGKKLDKALSCSRCMGGVPTSHSWYVWERGHKGAEVTSAIYPKDKPHAL